MCVWTLVFSRLQHSSLGTFLASRKVGWENSHSTVHSYWARFPPVAAATIVAMAAHLKCLSPETEGSRDSGILSDSRFWKEGKCSVGTGEERISWWFLNGIQGSWRKLTLTRLPGSFRDSSEWLSTHLVSSLMEAAKYSSSEPEPPPTQFLKGLPTIHMS